MNFRWLGGSIRSFIRSISSCFFSLVTGGNFALMDCAYCSILARCSAFSGDMTTLRSDTYRVAGLGTRETPVSRSSPTGAQGTHTVVSGRKRTPDYRRSCSDGGSGKTTRKTAGRDRTASRPQRPHFRSGTTFHGRFRIEGIRRLCARKIFRRFSILFGSLAEGNGLSSS